MINATRQKLRREYDHAREQLDRNQKKVVKLLDKLYLLNKDRDAWLRESERATQAMYKIDFPDDGVAE
jgi:hypothetical protein